MFGTDHFAQLCRRRGTADVGSKKSKESRIGGSEGERIALNFIQDTFSNISMQRNLAVAGISELMAPPSNRSKQNSHHTMQEYEDNDDDDEEEEDDDQNSEESDDDYDDNSNQHQSCNSSSNIGFGAIIRSIGKK
ncbi:hypothetical protein I4U23_016105 [Adineta vaga]|nr:hypothetical protein I4U23_016105 [Adineta vaga]